MAFIFYDTETTGTDTTFDQILQFAAILMDDDFSERDRFEIRCQLLPHIVPAPGALLATRVPPSMLIDRTLPSHYEAMCAIADKLRSWSPAVFVGYNSLAFDEPLLRQAFYQNLKPVYLSNTKGNTRADIYRAVQAASIYAPNSIVVPLTAAGSQTRRLDAIAPANGFEHENAHEAVADVEATIFMARLVKERAPDVWQSLMPLAAKPAVIERVQSGHLLSLTDFYGGKPYSWVVVGCGQNPEYDAQLGVFDLRYDPLHYIDLPTDQLISVMNSSKKAIRGLRANNQPILLPFDLAPEGLHDLNLEEVDIERRVRLIGESQEFQARVGEALVGRFETREPSPYVEARIYDGFASWQDNQLLERFHSASPEARSQILDQLEDERLRDLGYRLIYTERPEILPSEIRAKLDAWRTERLFTEDEGVPWRTIPQALAEAEDRIAQTEGDSDDLLIEIQAWLRATMI
jgi:exodeoxyribonuclease-1